LAASKVVRAGQTRIAYQSRFSLHAIVYGAGFA
jgi:hypothetical protein